MIRWIETTDPSPSSDLKVKYLCKENRSTTYQKQKFYEEASINSILVGLAKDRKGSVLITCINAVAK